ncbi:MAG: TraB/GumN family protein [Ferruginibacter sp.]
MKIRNIILPLFLFYSCRAQQPAALPANSDNNSLLWEISGNGLQKPSYLFGTFHLMCREDINFSASLKLAFTKAEETYFEMDLDDPSNTLGALLFMNMKNGKTLKDLYTDAEYDRLQNYFKDSLGTPLTMLNRMKPNFLEALLYPKMMPCKNMSGVEEELMKMAKAQKKEIKGFETIAFQSAIFDSIPYEKQAKDLLKTIDSVKEYKKSFDTMLLVYKTQQLSEIEGMFNKTEFGLDDNRDVLLDNRNKNWVEQLKKILPHKSIFMAVGAGHLVGEKGVIELLKKEGYTLRPLLNKDK